jgi:hypothetical protein
MGLLMPCVVQDPGPKVLLLPGQGATGFGYSLSGRLTGGIVLHHYLCFISLHFCIKIVLHTSLNKCLLYFFLFIIN